MQEGNYTAVAMHMVIKIVADISPLREEHVSYVTSDT